MQRYLPEHCYRRGAKGLITYDRAIPQKLRPYANQRSVKRSLGSSDPAYIGEALLSAQADYCTITVRAEACAEAEGEHTRRRATATQNYSRLVGSDRKLVDDAGGVDGFMEAARQLRGFANLMEFARTIGEDGPEMVYADNESGIEYDEKKIRRSRREHGVVLEEAEDDAREAEGVMAALGVPVEAPHDTSERDGPLKRKVTLVDVARNYKEGDVSPSTQASLVVTAKQFNEFHDSPDIRDLKSEHYAAYLEALRDAPVQTQREVARKPFREMLRLSRDLDLKKISHCTARKRLTYVKMLTTQSAALGIVESDPFGNQKTLPLQKRGKKRQWKPFSTDELLQIEDLVEEKWRKTNKIDRVWTFYLLVYHGCRRSEICQLMVSDVDTTTRTLSLINEYDDDDEDSGDGVTQRSVKGDNARRTIPIHDVLIEMGFLEFVEQRRKAGKKRLFPSFTIDKHGKVGASFSANFRYLTRDCLKITDTLKVLHSIRGNWTDAARHGDVNPEIRKAIAGRALTDDSVENGYGSGYSVERMRVELNKVYPLKK